MSEEKKKSWFRRHPILSTFFAIFLFFIIIGMFQGFSDEKESTQNEAAPYKFNERFEHGDFAYTFHNVATKSEIGEHIFGEFIGEYANGKFLVFDVTVENIAKETKNFWDDTIQLVDDQDRVFDTDDSAWVFLDDNEAFAYEQMQPNLAKRGKIVFDIPEGVNWKVRIAKNSFSSNYVYVEQ